MPRVVCFDSPAPEIQGRLFAGLEVVDWRAAVPQHVLDAEWEGAYRFVERLLQKSPRGWAAVADAYFHECAFHLFRLRVWDLVRAGKAGPAMAVMQKRARQKGWTRRLADAGHRWLRHIEYRSRRLAHLGTSWVLRFAALLWHGGRWTHRLLNGAINRRRGWTRRFLRYIAYRDERKLRQLTGRLHAGLRSRIMAARERWRRRRRIGTTGRPLFPTLPPCLRRARTALQSAAVLIPASGLLVLGAGARCNRWLGRLTRGWRAGELAVVSDLDYLWMTVEDSGTGVNFSPALEVLRAVDDRDRRVLVLTTNDANRARLEDAGVPAVTVLDGGRRSSLASWLAMLGFSGCLLRTVLGRPNRESILAGLRVARWARGRNRDPARLPKELAVLATRFPPRALLTVYESLPLSIMTGRWAVDSKVPWIGMFPILLGRRPDCRHFPADRHLVYGAQLTELLLERGVRPETVTVVGSPTYDIPEAMNRASARKRIEQDFPALSGRRLVVVATEAFADPSPEIIPILRTLSGMDGVGTILKLHPEDDPKFFRSLIEQASAQSVILVENYDLATLLAGSELLMAIVSNVIITAAMLGTPNLVCDFSGKSAVVDFVAEGLSSACRDVAELEGKVRALVFDPGERERAIEAMEAALPRFNGPADSRSAVRIAEYWEAAARESSGSVSHGECKV